MKKVAIECAERELGSGLCCIAVRNPGVPTFAAVASFRVGQCDETAREHGLAYFTGTMLEEGTRQRDSIALAEAVEEIGASLDTTSNGAAVHCPADEAKKAVRLLHEVLLEPAFDAREARRIQGEILAEIEADEADPRSVARLRFRAEAYGAHPFARPRYGSRTALAALRSADLVRFHRRWFVPQETIVAAVGPFETEETLDLLAKTFRGFRGTAPERAPVVPPEMPAERRDVHLPMDREQVHVYLGHAGIRRADPDYIPLLVMDHVLGTGPGFTSRIGKKLRDEQGLCYSVSAGITSGAGLEPSLFAAYIGTSPEHRKRAIDGFLTEIRAIRSTPPTDQEVRDVQDYLTGNWVFGLERSSHLASYVLSCRRFGLGYDYLERYPDLVRAVTTDDVMRAAQTHLDPKRVLIVSAGAGAK
ncbi:MAG: pitrilysin family protein [Planctomycetota bacterium]